jgi:large subunit ribosomal protein L18
MLTKLSSNTNRVRIHTRIRKKVQGSPTRPRLSVYRSLNNLYVQIIDDLGGVTLVAASTAEGKKGERQSGKKTGGNLAAAKELGKLVAGRAQAKGIKQVVFDRGGYIYHGRVKALADAAREAGLQF